MVGKTTAQGNVVLAITDAATGFDAVESLILSVSEVRLHSRTKGWITISEEKKQFDLLKLKESSTLGLLAEGNADAGSYDQIRLTLQKILIVSGGKTNEAKLPSNDLKITGELTVQEGKTSTVLMDFLADKSLHMTGSGKFIFAPVVTLETRKDAEAHVISDTSVKIEGGEITAHFTAGTDENGDTRSDFVLDAHINLEIIGDTIKVVTKEEEKGDAEIKVTAKDAINIATRGKYLDSALSVKLTDKNNKKVWRVSGFKTLEVTIVYIDVTSGTVISVE